MDWTATRTREFVLSNVLGLAAIRLQDDLANGEIARRNRAWHPASQEHLECGVGNLLSVFLTPVDIPDSRAGNSSAVGPRCNSGSKSTASSGPERPLDTRISTLALSHGPRSAAAKLAHSPSAD